MSDRQQPRNLTPGPRRWKAVGGDRVHQCTFFGGGPTEAVVGCPDGDAPILWQVAVCRECLTDLIMTRLAAVKHQRTVALARDMNAAVGEIVKLRHQARREKRDPTELRTEELAIREKFGLKIRPFTTSRAGDRRCCDHAPRAPWLNRIARSASSTGGKEGAPCVRGGMDLLVG
jgi:hypothetical protein